MLPAGGGTGSLEFCTPPGTCSFGVVVDMLPDDVEGDIEPAGADPEAGMPELIEPETAGAAPVEPDIEPPSAGAAPVLMSVVAEASVAASVAAGVSSLLPQAASASPAAIQADAISVFFMGYSSFR